MHIEKLSPEEIVKLEIGTGEPIIFRFKMMGFLCGAQIDIRLANIVIDRCLVLMDCFRFLL